MLHFLSPKWDIPGIPFPSDKQHSAICCFGQQPWRTPLHAECSAGVLGVNLSPSEAVRTSDRDMEMYMSEGNLFYPPFQLHCLLHKCDPIPVRVLSSKNLTHLTDGTPSDLPVLMHYDVFVRLRLSLSSTLKLYEFSKLNNIYVHRLQKESIWMLGMGQGTTK